ncbi:uncharacterized protein [Amphiura filiformis]|uniref:uncharacterized protein n=1 Tax=Amphiura filiformis TaxID=82378 RepID=UPI003B225166
MKNLAVTLLVIVVLACVFETGLTFRRRHKAMKKKDSNTAQAMMEEISRAEEILAVLEDLEVKDQVDDGGLVEALEEREDQLLEKLLVESLKEQRENDDEN